MVGWFGLEEKICFDELLMEEERLEQKCDGSFLSSGEIALFAMTHALSLWEDSSHSHALSYSILVQ